MLKTEVRLLTLHTLLGMLDNTKEVNDLKEISNKIKINCAIELSPELRVAALLAATFGDSEALPAVDITYTSDTDTYTVNNPECKILNFIADLKFGGLDSLQQEEQTILLEKEFPVVFRTDTDDIDDDLLEEQNLHLVLHYDQAVGFEEYYITEKDCTWDFTLNNIRPLVEDEMAEPGDYDEQALYEEYKDKPEMLLDEIFNGVEECIDEFAREDAAHGVFKDICFAKGKKPYFPGYFRMYNLKLTLDEWDDEMEQNYKEEMDDLEKSDLNPDNLILVKSHESLNEDDSDVNDEISEITEEEPVVNPDGSITRRIEVDCTNKFKEQVAQDLRAIKKKFERPATLKAKDVLAILGISRASLSGYVKQGLIKATTSHEGGQYEYDAESVYELKRKWESGDEDTATAMAIGSDLQHNRRPVIKYNRRTVEVNSAMKALFKTGGHILLIADPEDIDGRKLFKQVVSDYNIDFLDSTTFMNIFKPEAVDIRFWENYDTVVFMLSNTTGARGIYNDKIRFIADAVHDHTTTKVALLTGSIVEIVPDIECYYTNSGYTPEQKEFTF